MAPTDDFGQWLKRRRKAQGLTQKQVAQRVGCAAISVRKIESGDLQPSATLVAAIAAVLEVPETDVPGLVSLAHGTGDDFTIRARLLRPQRPNNLPAQLTPVIGRSRDTTAVRKRLLGDGARLITLLGPPGVGKTRLSLAVAEDVVEQFDDGVFFVRLAPVSDPGQVAAAIAQALGLQMSGPNPPELQLRAYLEEKHLLLVLDNFEQIVAAAPLVDDLLRRCPWLHVLVTSRQPLRVRGERQMMVQPLALPAAAPAGSVATADDMLRYLAVALFADRAEAVQPDFAVDDGNAAVVAELCRRLDGLPLAIELVAARVKLLPPTELLQRLHGPWLLSTDGLRDVSARQKTLRGAIGWSYDLLSPAEQTLFRYLSVFVGGFTLEAAELLCGDNLSPPLPLTFTPTQVLDGIASLLDKSLMHRETGLYGGPRYTMLETVREYAVERLVLNGEEAVVRKRHMDCVLRRVENAEQEDFSPLRDILLRQIDDEIYNLRAALEWATENDVQVALLLTAVLLSWLFGRGPQEEGKRLVAKSLTLPGPSAHTIPRVKALFEAGVLMQAIREYGKCQAFHEECLTISQELGYKKGEADALLGLGQVAHNGWYDQDAAQGYLDKALTIYRELHDLRGISYATVVSSYVAIFQADLVKARAFAEECIALADQAVFSNPWPLLSLSSIALLEGNLIEARSLMEHALPDLEVRGQKASTLMWLGIVATIQDDFIAAHAFFDELLLLLKELGSEKTAVAAVPLALLAQKEGDQRRAIQWYRMGLPRMKVGTDTLRLGFLGLAALAESMDQHELAARLLGATSSELNEHREPCTPFGRDDYDRLADAARSHLGKARYDAAWALGWELAFEQVVEEAVAILEKVLGVDEQTGLKTRHA